MPSSQTLAELKTRLTNSIADGRLALKPDSTQVSSVDAFVSSLPAAQLVLSGPQFTMQEQTFPQTLTVGGSVSDHWKIRGLDNDGVAVSAARLVFTQARAGAEITGELFAEGSFTVGAQEVALTGVLTAENSLRFAEQRPNAISLPLTDIGNFISNSRMGDYLPAGVTNFESVPVTKLEASFGYAGMTSSVLSFTTDVNTDWEFISGFAPLKSVGVTLVATYSQPTGAKLRAAFSGNIHATFHLGRDFSVILAFQAKDFWEVRIIPAEGNTLPTLADVAQLVGGDSLQASVQSGLDAIGLGGITLVSVIIGFDLNARTLSYARMEGRIGFAGKTLEVAVQLPDFMFGGTLPKETPLSLREFVAAFFGASENFPDVYLTEFGFSAYPSGSAYSVHVTIEDDEFRLGPVSLKQVSFDLDKSGGGFAGGISAALTIAGVDVFISANNPAAGGEWEFSGSTGKNQKLPIGDLIQDLAHMFGDITLPSALESLSVENLHASFDTGQKKFTFGCESTFRADDTDVDILVNLVITKVGGTYTKDFSGVIKIGGLDFTLYFVQNATSDFFVATYHPDVPGQAQDVKQLIQSLSATVAGYVPEGLTIELKDVLFAYRKNSQNGGGQGTAPSKFIFGLDIGTGINLSNLPLVGQEFPKDATVGVDDLQILFISEGLNAGEVDNFNALIPDGVTKLPVQTQQQGTQTGGGSDTSSTTNVVIQQGFNLSAQMQFGDSTQVLSLPAASSSAQSDTTATTTAGTNASATDSAKWFMLQKAFGPVYFEKVGVQYRDKNIWFLLSATLTAAGLSLSLDGLAVGGPLDKYMPPSFDLRGIGVEYSSGPVRISGAFLRQQVTQGNVTYDEYDGAALIKTEQLTLSAIGSYAQTDGHPSLFIYAVLDYPVGGPSFFFITGLAAGFGYNRALVSPTIEQVAQFPLVSEAVAGAGMPSNLSAELQKLRQYVPPEVGEYFLAVGIKFTSFKLVDSFALLTVSFGRRFEIDVLGLSTLIVPTPLPGQSVTPLAEVQMAVKASYVPDEGFLGISAQLTSNSFILSRNCHLTGGFAFWSWFAGPHQGDFVLTLGGYHPSYNPPAHYPRVPRLGFNWRVDENISIKGDLYYALTASALMAGGGLQATWESESLKAWFSVGANFIIAWKPYHYDASMCVDIGVSYTYQLLGTHTLNVNVGADLHLWGPEFSGKAHIKLWIISFDITFGSNSSQTPGPIDWPTFKSSFLPPDSQVCTLAMKSGLVKETDAGWVVNPKEFLLVTNSVIPSTEAYAGANEIAGAGDGAQLGIAPMKTGAYVARQTITILKDGEHCEDGFDFLPVRKKVPAAMWGRSFSPALNGPAFVDDALAGYEIRPKAKPQVGATAAIDPGVLQYSSETVPDAFAWETFAEFTPGTGSDAERLSAIKHSLTQPATASARAHLLSAFGLLTTVTVTDTAADALFAAPRIGTLAA